MLIKDSVQESSKAPGEATVCSSEGRAEITEEGGHSDRLLRQTKSLILEDPKFSSCVGGEVRRTCLETTANGDLKLK